MLVGIHAKTIGRGAMISDDASASAKGTQQLKERKGMKAV